MDNQYQNNYQQNGYYYQPPQPAQYQYPQQAYPPQGYYPPYPQQPYAPPKKKEYKLLSKSDSRLFTAMLLLGFMFFNFAVFEGFHLGYTIFYILFFAATTIYLPKRKPSLFAICTGALSVAGSVTFAIGSNNLIKFMMFVLIAVLYALYCIEITDTWRFRKGSFKALIDVVLSYAAYPFINLPDLFGSLRATGTKRKKLIAVLTGVAVSFPALLVIVPLLVKSDAAFEGLVTAIFKNIGLVIFEIVLAILFTPYLVSMLFGKKYSINKKYEKHKEYNGSVPVAVGVSFLSVISITYVVYLISQLAYFLSAFSGFLPDDYEKTASAFARRGFFEMFAVCVINVLIVSVVSFITKKREDGKLSGGVKGLSCFISLFSFFLIATALAKMKLNVETYGFTTNRLLVTAFIVMVFFAILFFIIHIFVPKFNYFRPLAVICSVIFIALAFLNVDAFVANYNVRAYQDGKLDSVDVDNIDTVAGIPYLIELIDDDNEKIASRAANAIVSKLSWDGYNGVISGEGVGEFESRGQFKFEKAYDFRAYSYTDYAAYNCLVDYGNSLNRNERRALQEKADSYWEKYAWSSDDEGYYDFDEDEVLDYVGTAIDLDLIDAAVTYQEDTHGGFNGDGIYYAEISLDADNKTLDEIIVHPDWQAMPLQDNLNRAVFGAYDENEDWYYESVLESDNISVPEVENGYYYFIDESPDAQIDYDDTDYIPLNFTIAIYDTDVDMLYFVEYDS